LAPTSVIMGEPARRQHDASTSHDPLFLTGSFDKGARDTVAFLQQSDGRAGCPDRHTQPSERRQELADERVTVCEQLCVAENDTVETLPRQTFHDVERGRRRTAYTLE